MPYLDKSILAIIPARGGSKGIKKKNLALLNGKPLIEHTISHALGSEYLDQIAVSSDDDEILEFSSQYQLEVVKRPLEIAHDSTPMTDVVLHLLDYYASKNQFFDFFVLLQPTSPFRNSQDIDSSIELLYQKGYYSCISICDFEPHPYLAVRKEGKVIKPYFKESLKYSRRQDYPPFYRINGAIYVVDSKSFLQKKIFVSPSNTLYYEMPLERSIDIDTLLDLKFAEFLLRTK